MKKLYTIAIAAAVALSATAGGRQLPASNVLDESNMVLKTPALFNTTAPSRAISSIDDLAGDYELSFTPLLRDFPSSLPVVISITGTNTIGIEIVALAGYGFSAVLPATVDLAAGTVSIANMLDLGKDSDGYDTYFYLKPVEGSSILDGASDVAATVGTIDENGNISFPPLDVWAIGDPNDEEAGFWILTYRNVIAAPEADPEMPGTWKSAGKATYIDGWMIPGIYNEQTDKPYDQYKNPWIVDVEQCVEDAHLFRVVNPYMSPAPLNGGYEGYILFDVTDPACVLVYPGYNAGISNGTNKLRFFNLEGYYFVDFGGELTTQDIIHEFAQDATPTSTYADGRVKVENCCFNYRGSANPICVWSYKNAAGESVSCVDLMHGEIVFDTIPDTGAGVSSVTVDNNAPAVYYNLQGVRVDNPGNGLYIRRQGNTVTKVMAK